MLADEMGCDRQAHCGVAEDADAPLGLRDGRSCTEGARLVVDLAGASCEDLDL